MFSCFGALALLAAAAAAQPVRVQITTGGHAFHPSFYRVFENDEFQLTADAHPSAFRRDLRKAVDVLVLYDLADTTGERERKNLQSFIDAGKGLVVIHHALADNWQWKWWYEEVTGGRFLMAAEGELPRSVAKAGEVLNARAVTEHPVLKGVPPLRFEDEVYSGMWRSPKARVLMETDNPKNDKAVVWIGPHPTSRVVCIQLGHGPASYADAGYRRLVHNAILWAAGKLD